MVYVRRTLTWLCTGLTLLVGILWFCGWAVWHTQHRRATLSHRDDDQLPPMRKRPNRMTFLSFLWPLFPREK
jgi:hypothetical protein